jgi:hypothetical protein
VHSNNGAVGGWVTWINPLAHTAYYRSLAISSLEEQWGGTAAIFNNHQKLLKHEAYSVRISIKIIWPSRTRIKFLQSKFDASNSRKKYLKNNSRLKSYLFLAMVNSSHAQHQSPSPSQAQEEEHYQMTNSRRENDVRCCSSLNFRCQPLIRSRRPPTFAGTMIGRNAWPTYCRSIFSCCILLILATTAKVREICC